MRLAPVRRRPGTRPRPPARRGWLAGDVFRRWREVRATHLGAALAYYALLSLAPLLAILARIARGVLGETAAREALTRQAHALLGPEGARPIDEFLSGVHPFESSAVGTLATCALLLWGAALVFSHLKTSLDLIWKVERPRHPLLRFLLSRIAALVLMVAMVAVVVVEHSLTAVLAAVARWAPHVLPAPLPLLHTVDFAVSLLFGMLLVALVYKLLPDVPVAWRDVWTGAFVTALLAVTGKTLFSLYLSRVRLDTVYGAAVSGVVILLGVFVYAQILMLGAVMTAVHADRRRVRRNG